MAGKVSERLGSIAEATWFRSFITIVIVIAGVLVGLETYPGIREQFGDWIYAIDALILAIFGVEIAIRIGAFGLRPHRFFYDPWNVFDFVIVALCLLPFDTEYLAVVRLARVFRVLRLVSVLPKLQFLVGALLRSIPSIGYITILLSLHFYIYACIGTFMFAENDPVHFGSLHRSMISLFQVVTLEDWADIMYIQMYGSDTWPYDYFEQPLRSEASFLPAVVFFISFILFGTMIILNLFVGVIMTGMMDMHAEAEARKLLAKRDFEGLSVEDEISLLVNEVDEVHKQLQFIKRRLRHDRESAQGGTVRRT